MIADIFCDEHFHDSEWPIENKHGFIYTNNYSDLTCRPLILNTGLLGLNANDRYFTSMVVDLLHVAEHHLEILVVYQKVYEQRKFLFLIAYIYYY